MKDFLRFTGLDVLMNKPSYVLRCQDCNKESTVVRQTICPYRHEIDGVNEQVSLCPDCEKERREDI